jgi:hypothetical protein
VPVAFGGLPAHLALPSQQPDAAQQVARLPAATQLPVEHDGTAVDALREGLGMLTRAGIDVRPDLVVLLPALRGAGRRRGRGSVRGGERAVAWAIGLAEDSPLIPVTDVLLAAPERGLDADTALAHLFGIPALRQPVRPQDRGWHSWPGTELPGLALELGYPQITTLSGKIVRVDQDSAAALQAQLRRFEEKSGRPPGP